MFFYFWRYTRFFICRFTRFFHHLVHRMPIGTILSKIGQYPAAVPEHGLTDGRLRMYSVLLHDIMLNFEINDLHKLCVVYGVRRR